MSYNNYIAENIGKSIRIRFEKINSWGVKEIFESRWKPSLSNFGISLTQSRTGKKLMLNDIKVIEIQE